jgi:NAD(P)-dependent dehydrogenase (short-subunit alcohol dehydrogenase family)
MSSTGTTTDTTGTEQHPPTALLVGASRGLGQAMAAELLDRGWHVVGTVRDTAARTPLHELADTERAGGRLTVERLDVNDPGGLPPLRERLAHRRLDVLFVNAGITSHEQTPIGAVPTADFVDVMVTNALGPMRVIEALEDLVTPAGLIGAMSSGQGSITNNTAGGREVYRGSKAALNMFLRSFAARQSGTRRAFLLLAPGWIRTALGGPDAPYSVEQSVPVLVDLLLSRLGTPGLAYLDRFGETVPW